MAPLPSRSSDLAHILPLQKTLPSSLASLAQRFSSNLVRRASELSLSLSRNDLTKRQTIVAIPTTYGSLNSGPSPGTVVGIVLGSVFGFLLILWLLYTVFTFGGGGRLGMSSVTTEVVRERRRSGTKSRGTRSRSRRRVSEIVERSETRRVSPRRMPPPPPAPAPMERVIVEERREERRESRPPPSVRRVSEDEVVVIEEHSPPRRKSSRRNRSRETAGAYRTVDPLSYGGGNAPMREVSRKTNSRRSRG